MVDSPISVSPHEDYAPNIAHTIILLLSIISCLVLALVSRKRRGQFRPLARYSLAASMAVLFFCMLIKWQPWITRLQLGEFVLFIPLAAIPISFLTIAPAILVLILMLQALPAMFNNASRPIIGTQSIRSASPIDVLFMNRSELKVGYVRLADEIAKLRPKQIGLVIGVDSWEFPLWYLLRQRLQVQDMPTIIHEHNEQVIDLHSDVVVYVEGAHHPVTDGMMEIPGFEPLRLYWRTR